METAAVVTGEIDMHSAETDHTGSGHARALRTVFLQDHRAMTRGFMQALDAVEGNRLDEAARIADEIDRVAGPHMAFEETELYPRLRAILGDTDVDRLYGEHEEGRQAVATLLTGSAGEQMSPGGRRRVADQLRTALDHAVSCGTLLSHIDAFSVREQASMLERLLALRSGGRRWCTAQEAAAH